MGFNRDGQAIRQLLQLAGQIEKIFLENVQRARAVVQMHGSSAAKRNFSFLYFSMIVLKKRARCPAMLTRYRALGVQPLAAQDTKSSSGLNFIHDFLPVIF
jgi:hypothetical protein